MKITYDYSINFRGTALDVVEQAEEIATAYADQGYDLTLRGLYYQFVARDLFPDDRKWREDGGRWVRDPNGTKNAEPNYKWLGGLVGDARMAGIIDWDHLVDQGRTPSIPWYWDSAQQIIDSSAREYRIDKWTTQPRMVEVWVEKDALSQVVGRAADRFDVGSFACKGYVSASAMWSAAQRHGDILRDGKALTILYLGDHDPSGIDMTRDIESRLTTFLHTDLPEEIDLYTDDTPDGLPLFEVRRIALTMEQIRQYNPPPNPAKVTDSRAAGYIARHGNLSWELDALDPPTLDALITQHLRGIRDEGLYADRQREENEQRRVLTGVRDRWPTIERFWDDLADHIDELD